MGSSEPLFVELLNESMLAVVKATHSLRDINNLKKKKAINSYKSEILSSAIN